LFAENAAHGYCPYLIGGDYSAMNILLSRAGYRINEA
jgi:hypothetical protein